MCAAAAGLRLSYKRTTGGLHSLGALLLKHLQGCFVKLSTKQPCCRSVKVEEYGPQTCRS